MKELKKGKLFKLLEDNTPEDQLVEYININGKMKPYCPIIFTKATIVEQENVNEREFGIKQTN